MAERSCLLAQVQANDIVARSRDSLHHVEGLQSPCQGYVAAGSRWREVRTTVILNAQPSSDVEESQQDCTSL